jgi:hypothetical protein
MSRAKAEREFTGPISDLIRNPGNHELIRPVSPVKATKPVIRTPRPQTAISIFIEWGCRAIQI